jgi:hypothetical protein
LIQFRQSQIALNKLSLQCTSAEEGFRDQFQLKQIDHSSTGSLSHHPHVHSHQSPQPPLQEIFGCAQHTLPLGTNRHVIHCHPTKITTTNNELESKSSRKWLQTIQKHDKKELRSQSGHV